MADANATGRAGGGDGVAPGVFPALVLLGLALRCAGLVVNAMYDIDEIMFDWGAVAHAHGLGAAFGINYGLFSYAFYGAFYAVAEVIPAWWWVPYKAAEIAFEAAILWALLRILGPGRERIPLLLFWLNPWFILHGGWHGFWEGPHVFLGLAAVLAARHIADGRRAWFAVGVLLMSAAMFKPQGLLHFALPAGLYLCVQWLRTRDPAVVWYSLGLAAVTAAGTAWIVALGGRPTAILDNYRSVAGSMPSLCNDCISAWRAVATMLGRFYDMPGPPQSLVLPPLLDMALQGMATVATLAAITFVAWRTPLRPRAAGGAEAFPRDQALLILLTMATLVMSQLGTRAHVNHGYTAMVLLIPFVAGEARALAAWCAMVAVQLYAHLWYFGLGRTSLLPGHRSPDPAVTERLLRGIEAVQGQHPAQPLLDAVAAANAWLHGRMAHEPALSALSLLMLAGAVVCAAAVLRTRPAR